MNGLKHRSLKQQQPMSKLSAKRKRKLEIQLSFGVSDGKTNLRKGVPSKQSFQQFAQAALDASGASGLHASVGLSIRFVDTAEARAMNHQYRGKDYATNVLSFPVEAFGGALKEWLGDLVICVPVIAREAAEFGKPLRDHYAHMCVHGVLHLLGFDHIKKADQIKMEAIETAVLAQLGIGDPYVI
jgi:probable rRNA maturation factor